MKKILFMHQSSNIGGGSYCLLNMVKALDRKEWDITVALRGPGPLVNEFKSIGVPVIFFSRMAGIPYNQPLSLRTLLAYKRVLSSEKKIEGLLLNEKIDVLYLNNMMLAPYLRPAKKVGCKTVLHVREHWPLNEHLKQLEWVRKIVYENCDELIAINHFSASIFPKKDSTIVYDWIDMSHRYKPLPLSIIFNEDMTGKRVLLYTGGIDSIKGGDYVLDAFTDYIKGDDYRLLMMGCNNIIRGGWKHKVKCFLTHLGYHYRELEMQRKADCDKRVRRIGNIYELNHLIEQSYCFVSYFRMPHANLALAENIIMGNPCIAADTEESREYSGDGKYAMLVSPLNTTRVFAHSLKAFLDDHDKWGKAARDGARIIGERFDTQRNVSSLLSVLRGL